MDMKRTYLKRPMGVVCYHLLISSIAFLIVTSSVFAASEDEDANFSKSGASRSIAAAQDQDDDEGDEYNFSWLDPDKKVYVLQNRKYRKSRKFAVYLSGGFNLSNPFKSELMAVPRLSYHFTEQFGIEALYSFINNTDSDNYVALKKVNASALPFVREHKNYLGGLFAWSPWYAKINFFNKILYFDWGLNAGLGQVYTYVDKNNKTTGAPNVVNESFSAFFLGTSQNYFITRQFSVRLDLIGMFYRAAGADGSTTKTYKNFDFTVGAGYVF